MNLAESAKAVFVSVAALVRARDRRVRQRVHGLSIPLYPRTPGKFSNGGEAVRRQGVEAVRWRGGEAVRWQGSEVAGWQGGEVAGWQGGEVAGLQSLSLRKS